MLTIAAPVIRRVTRKTQKRRACHDKGCGNNAFRTTILDRESVALERRSKLEDGMPAVGKRRGGRTLRHAAFGLLALIAPGVGRSHAEDCKFFSGLPDDCARAEFRKFDGLRDYRYDEIELFAKDPLKKVLYVSFYDTTGLNGGDDSHDSAPAELARRLDPKRIAKQYQAIAVRVQPPYYWTVDWLADRFGTVRSFDGLNAAWMGNSLAPSTAISPKPAPPTPYHPTLSARTAVQGFKKGSEIYLLDDPKGRTWVMVSYTNKDMPDLTIDKLSSLGDALKLPQGWKFRTETLPKELVLEPKAGFFAVIQDDKENLYHLTGPRQSNFVP
jgi:hypothetical protein